MELETKGKWARASTSSSILAGDRLSSLPDCLIHHIMSFMKARQVVQTSVPCLDIDLEEFKTAGPKRGIEEVWDKFQDFTDHLLIPNNISIALLDTFCLNLGCAPALRYDYTKLRQAGRWIRHGIKYSTQEPGIQRQGLSSSSWRLKRLDLSTVCLDESFAKHVSSGCQYLQDWELKGCSCTFHEISSHSLKKLILENCTCYGLSAITSPTLKRLVINRCTIVGGCLPVVTAPAVASLFLSMTDYMLLGDSLNGMPSIVEAWILLLESGHKLVDSYFKLLDSVSNVACLNLSGFKALVWSSVFANVSCSCSAIFSTLNEFVPYFLGAQGRIP